ncbi:MAG: undecaprenyl/decaprenyl-phosphate alpha-N-acetylglucosaminyl 1-phosphate transferase [Bacteroidia bacterium]|nr:undecaprenyl/decaprenyl-phosphate alpha-N-acetylglucosaminyl 1-phosphate transferase [Bacteroidia bacterium]MDW8235445.1 MraY family glycosyltransferase [Bacteroidia bacterium]
MTTWGVAFVGFLSAWVWNEIFLRFARRLGALSQGIPNQRRWDSRRKPIIGGIAFFIAALGLGAWRPAGAEVSHAFLAGGSIAFLTGLADDAFVSLPHIKLLGQLAAAAASLLFGGHLLEVGNTPLSLLFTFFWYVAVMNAFNMMDNMDGISGTIALVLLSSSFFWLSDSSHLLLYAALSGGVLAFLYRNWHPSHLYMGDNGSQFLGFVLAYWGAELWNSPPLMPISVWEKILLLIGLFALLAGDTFWVILVRLWEKRSPFNGGTDHLTHRLARQGFSPTHIAIALGLGQILLVLACAMAVLQGWLPWIPLLLIGVSGVAIGFFHLSELKQPSLAKQAEVGG